MVDSYLDYLTEKLAKNVMREVGSCYEIAKAYPKVYNRIKVAIKNILQEEDIE